MNTAQHPVIRPGLMHRDLARLAVAGLRTRKLRAGLSGLGIAIGVAAIVAVLGLAASSQAGLLAEIDRLGTNMLRVESGQTIFGQPAPLPASAPAMIGRIDGVSAVAHTESVPSVSVYRSPLIPAIRTGAISVRAASLDVPAVTGATMAEGRFLNAATARYPVAVLGALAAQRLGIDHTYPGMRIWLGGQWFYVAGILGPAVLAPEIDTSVLVGYPAAETYLGADAHPSTIYVRSELNRVEAVRALLAPTANPERPNEADVSQPSDALVARAATESALNGLFLSLGVVALLVGGIGVANIMIISVLERRSEIGLRRALGATRGNIRAQFFGEAMVLSVLGGLVGDLVGAVATIGFAVSKDWSVVVPPVAWVGGLLAALLIGAVAGILPAARAARMSPTEALWAV